MNMNPDDEDVLVYFGNVPSLNIQVMMRMSLLA